MKTEVYSWRMAADLKAGLEQQARRSGHSLAAWLDQAAREWLAYTADDPREAAGQQALHVSAARAIGTIASTTPHRAETARDAVRKRIHQRNGR